jgi:hypothetical protein
MRPPSYVARVYGKTVIRLSIFSARVAGGTRAGTLTVSGTTTSAATNVTVKILSQTNNVPPYRDEMFGAVGMKSTTNSEARASYLGN